jgi:hypothetical protein
VVLKPGRAASDAPGVTPLPLPADDRGDIVLGWLTKIVLTLALLGVVLFDGVALGAGRVQAQDRATIAARAAATSFAQDRDVQRAYDAALGTLEGSVVDTIDPTTFTVGREGDVTLVLVHRSTTLVVEKVGPLRDWATSSATGTARAVT